MRLATWATGLAIVVALITITALGGRLLARGDAQRAAATPDAAATLPLEAGTAATVPPQPLASAVAADPTDSGRRLGLGGVSELYIGEAGGAAFALAMRGVVGGCSTGVFVNYTNLERYDGVESQTSCLNLVREGDVLRPAEARGAEADGCCVQQGEFAGETLTLTLNEDWWAVPLGPTPRTLVLRRGTVEEYEDLRARAREAATARAVRFTFVTPTVAEVAATGSNGAPVALTVLRNPLRLVPQVLGGKRVLRVARDGTGVWVLEEGGVALRTFAGEVKRRINREWIYRSPEGPAIIPTELGESRDGLTRLYWRWREFAVLERDGQEAAELGVGTHALSADGRHVASYPAIGILVEAQVETRREQNFVEYLTTYAPTQLVVRDVSTGTSVVVAGDLRYARLWNSEAEDYGFRPPAPAWSSSGRFLLVPGWGSGAQAVYDVGRRTLVGIGSDEASWAPNADLLLLQNGTSARLLDPASGREVALGGALAPPTSRWRFEGAGDFVVRQHELGGGRITSTAFRSSTGAEVARADSRLRSVIEIEGSTAYAVEGIPGCGGLQIVHPRLEGGSACFDRAVAGAGRPKAATSRSTVGSMASSLECRRCSIRGAGGWRRSPRSYPGSRDSNGLRVRRWLPSGGRGAGASGSTTWRQASTSGE